MMVTPKAAPRRAAQPFTTARFCRAIAALAAIACACAAVVLLAAWWADPAAVLDWLERQFVSDGHLEARDRVVPALVSCLVLSACLAWSLRSAPGVAGAWPDPRRDRVGWYRGLGVALLALSAIHWLDALPPIDFWFYLREDGPLEMLTVLFAFAAAGLLVLAAVRAEGALKPVVVLGAAFFAFFAAEEISWGQRLIGGETPEAYHALNDQHETNLHNLVGHVTLNAGQALFSLVLGVLLLLPVERLAARWPSLTPILPPFTLRLVGALFVLSAPWTLWKGGEWPEEMLALLGLAFAIDLFRRTRDPG